MDVHMPRLDGIEATRRIRSSATGCNAKTPIVALTADALQSERDRFMQSGMDDYLSKPITQTALSGMIQTWVGKEVNAYGNP
jgi:two-component system sensor histidine kinase BarA